MADYFTPIRQVIDNMSKINQGLVLEELIEKRGLDKLIINLNTEGENTSQLFNLNINSKGVQLSAIGGNYSPFTLVAAQEAGRPKKGASSINLKDTGEFYDSFKVKVENDTIFIDADPNKDTSNLFDDWGEDIVGLTEENLQILIDAIEILLPEIIQELLFARVS